MTEERDDKDREIEQMKKLQELDQTLANISSTAPRLWRGIYDGLIEQGFNESQAIDLVKTFIQAAHGK